MKKRKVISAEQAKLIGESLQIDWDQSDLEEFRQGLLGKPTPRNMDPETGLAYDGILLAGQVVLSHMQEFPDYVTRLAKLRAEVDEYQSRQR